MGKLGVREHFPVSRVVNISHVEMLTYIHEDLKKVEGVAYVDSWEKSTLGWGRVESVQRL